MTAQKTQLHKGDLPDGLSLGSIVAIDTETLGLNPFRDRLCLALNPERLHFFDSRSGLAI